MWLQVFGIGFASAAVLAALIVFKRRRAKRRRLALAAVMRTRLGGLLRAAQEWAGCEFDLVRFDSDRDPKSVGRRMLHLRPKPGVDWHIETDLQQRYRLGYEADGRETWYPERFGWSDEPWLKAQVDLLLLVIAELPAPRTHEAWMKRSNEEFEARMQKHRAWMASLPALPEVPSSLDDPCDDME